MTPTQSTAPLDRQTTPADDIILATTPTVDGLPHTTIGLVTATYIARSVDMGTKRIQHQLRKNAADVGADAVVAVQIAVTAHGDESGAFTLVAAGTAVLLPWPRGHADPTLITEQAPAGNR